MKTVTATDANRDFSKLLEIACNGEEVAITKRGKVVATLGPATYPTDGEAERRAAWQLLRSRLLSQKPLEIGRFSRDAIYDEITGI